MRVDLYPHQQKAVDQLANGKILWGGVGTGKSLTAMAYFYTKVCNGVSGDWGSVRTPRDIYVITTAKKRDGLDWEEEARKFGIGRDRDASVANIMLTVDSYNNLGKYREVKDAFFIFDEQRLVGSGAWSKWFVEVAKRNQWILLSATPGDTWLDYIPVFIANGWYKNRTEFKRRHVVYNTFSKFPKVDRYVETGTLVKRRNSILVEMPYVRHTVRHSRDVEVAYDEELFKKVVEKRWHVYENRPLRDVAELFSVMRKVVNSDPSRLKSIRHMMDTHPRMIVFYNFDYELEILRSLLSSSEKTFMGLPSTELGASVDATIPLTQTDFTSSLRVSTSHKKCSEPNGENFGKETTPRLQSLRSQPSLPSRTTSDSAPTSLRISGHSSTIIGRETISESRLTELMKPDSSWSDPLAGTIWEEGFDEKAELKKVLNTSLLEKSSNPSLDQLPPFSGSGSKSFTNDTRLLEENHQSLGLESSDELSKRAAKPTLGIEIAEWNGHKHEEVPKTDRWVYLVQYQAGAEGWNCVSTDAMVFYSLTYSYKLFHQAHGRIDRLNTPFTDLWYYTLFGNSLIEQAIKKSLGQKRSFNESSFKVK